ncbi:MAG: ABC transporter permease [Lachnospiraceae bacterium]|nr:ABC transporter permease [uncultured Acetatifactor sp.]MCI8287638.1 ABC transporter permease [Lachnospiraceae bacterium]
MKKGFYPKLAADNIRKNARTYIPYLITCVITVAMYYIERSLALNPGLERMAGSAYLNQTMFLGSRIIAIFALIFLFYTNSFLVKRRKKEFGVFHILGMEKRHLARVLGWESIYVTLLGIGFGLILGLAMDKAMYLIINMAIGGETIFGFFVSSKAVMETILLFAVIFLLICLHSIRQVYTANPVELLVAGRAGEKEPETKWFLTLAGLAALGGGYYIAFTTRNPIASLLLFFVAVLLVIAATYLLFTAGSIAFLKTLRKNKRYYYRTRHFVSISGMIYRMKQNAVGLANICVLSTMVLVMVSSTTSLMLGIEDIIRTRYPADFMLYFNGVAEAENEAAITVIRDLQEERNFPVTEEISYTYLAFSAFCDGDTFSVERDFTLGSVDAIVSLFFVPLSEYNSLTGEDRTLTEGEVLVHSERGEYEYPTLKLFGREYTVAGKAEEFVGSGIFAANITTTQYIIVTEDTFRELYQKQQEVLQEDAADIQQIYGFDTDAEEEDQIAFYEALREKMNRTGTAVRVESMAESRSSIVSMYGGFFFIGVFLGILFIMATVLIIYYKQISEGYDDKARFEILQKVGMDRDEIKDTIHSQVLTVFFLPLAAAGMHVAAAFPMISKLLELLNLLNTGLYIVCTIACFLIFAVMYSLIYLLTSRSYYRIVLLSTQRRQ